LLSVINSAQCILRAYVHPDGITKDQALNDLLSVFDGRTWRKARDVWQASVLGAQTMIRWIEPIAATMN
jgi:hypothetical protein